MMPDRGKSSWQGLKSFPICRTFAVEGALKSLIIKGDVRAENTDRCAVCGTGKGGEFLVFNGSHDHSHFRIQPSFAYRRARLQKTVVHIARTPARWAGQRGGRGSLRIV